MFKKLKDKLAEEVKSSPQRIQQIAQAAQAAVTSASSSISDITNNELFSIGDNDGQQPRSTKASSTTNSQQNTFQDVSLVQPLQSSTDTMDYSHTSQDILDNQRQRRLSNSSFASDVSFRLPSYETPSMYHLQSDMEVSASEAEERGFSSGTVSLDRVTKEQLYAAYRRTQERYTKYRTQYGDLARHYKLLERENAKARSVLVETQDKALRRISELREQCSLEQSAKAHLEKALRVEMEEKIMKIEALETKIKLIQNHSDIYSSNDKHDNQSKLSEGEGDVQLINLSNDNEVNQITDDSAEIVALNNKLEKTEQLLNKYKDSLKASKEKNSQINTELQILTNELENKSNEIEQLKLSTEQLAETEQKIQDLRSVNEELQNRINVYEFNKSREQSTLEIDYQKAQEEINELQRKIDIFSKREEENAISLAENKLSIHKELESKETLIKTLKESLDVSKKEIQSLNIVINDYKKNVTSLETERSKLMHNISELTSAKSKINELESQVEELSKKTQSLEQSKTKSDEAYKFLQLQMKQETAEKLAMIDRNTYLENRNTQLSEDNTKKSNQISKLESELQKRDTIIKEQNVENSNKEELFEELAIWKDKYSKLESEIQEERDELIKLQSEIEKLLSNHESLQTQNIEYRQLVSDLKEDNAYLREKVANNNKIKSNCIKLATDIKQIKKLVKLLSNDTKSLQIINDQAFVSLVKQINYTLNNVSQSDSNVIENDLKMKNTILQQQIETCTLKYESLSEELNSLRDENNNLKLTLSDLQLEKNNTDKEIKSITNEYEITITQLNIEKETIENLKLALNKLRLEKEAIDEEVKRVTNEWETTIKQLNVEKESNKNVELRVNELQIEKDTIAEELKRVTNEYETTKKLLNIEKESIENLQLTLNKLQLGKGSIDEEVRRITSEHQTTIEQLNIEKETNENMRLTLNELQLDKKAIDEEVGRISNEFETTVKQLNIEKQNNEDLQYKINEFENNFQNLHLAMEFEKKHKLESIETTNTLLNEKQSLLERIESLKNEINSTSAEFDALKDNYRIVIEELNIVKRENEGLLDQARTLDKNIEKVNTLQEENETLSLENISLKSQVETVANSLRNVELEVDGLRKINAEIVSKNDSLNHKIEELEENACKITVNSDSQTDNNDTETTKIVSETQGAFEANYGMLLEHESTSDTKLQQSVDSNDDLSNKYQSLKTEYDILKEENRRFKSDIEGLQTYLTKISKENSILNDKLREMIATSGNSIDNTETSPDLFDLKKEVQLSKAKVDDLMRENNLLIEENLELKDQIKNQNYPFSDDKSSLNYSESDNLIYKEKYNNLLQENNTIEKKLKDLEHINKSVDGNAIQMHEKNEKLKLVNEKLERRLDEALVSLRHLHSLQENTELEYLRNILYEYLTGTGMHSLTLAKVLSAIVKFDDMQTKLVLQKEKERQGFLRQLGII